MFDEFGFFNFDFGQDKLVLQIRVFQFCLWVKVSLF